MRRSIFLALCLAMLAGLASCFGPSKPLGGEGSLNDAAGDGGTGNTSEEAVPDNGALAADGHWKGYPDLPFLPIKEEIGSVEIPRVYADPGDYKAGGAVPVDEHNPAAKGESGEPVTGGSITVRYGAEPESLNPITGTGAYSQYVLSYVLDPLAWQNPETFEWEPYIAKKWVVEDSVKLRPDYPGHIRKVKRGDGEPGDSITIEIKSNPDPPGEPIPVALTVVDEAGKPVPNAWVGITSTGEEVKLSNNWTDENGVLETTANGIGTYRIQVGDELYGHLEDTEDGYSLTPATDKSELERLTLKKSDVINIERGTVFTYFLRDDVTWSDGARFTAKDLEFAHAVINNPSVDGDQIRVYYADVVEVEGLDDFTVRMKYRDQYFQAFEFTNGLALYTPPWHWFRRRVEVSTEVTLTMEKLTPDQEEAGDQWSVHGAAFAKFFNTCRPYIRAPLGTGSYVVGDWSEQDKQITVERREDYWNDEKGGYLDNIVFKFIEDDTTALQALKARQIDFFWRVPADQFFQQLDPPPDWLEEDYVKATWYSPGYRYVGWNLRRPIFKDHRVRLALAMLFDKQEFFQKKLYQSGILTSGSNYYFGPAYDRSVGSVGYDPAAARDLLADAGWIDTDGDGVLDKMGREFRFTLLMPPGKKLYEARAAVMQQSYREAGIAMEVRRMEWAAFLERLKMRNFDAVTLAWAMALEGDPFQLWHGSGAAVGNRGSNHVGFDNEKGDQLIKQIRVTLDDEKRKRLQFDFHRLLDREQPYMFLWTPKSRGIYHQRFRGVKFYALRPGYDLREWWIPKELQ